MLSARLSLLLLFLMQLPDGSDQTTIFSISGTVYCASNPDYDFKIVLLELDYGGHDVIAQTSRTHSDQTFHNYTITGLIEGGDGFLSTNYEIGFLVIHSCPYMYNVEYYHQDLGSWPIISTTFEIPNVHVSLDFNDGIKRFKGSDDLQWKLYEELTNKDEISI